MDEGKLEDLEDLPILSIRQPWAYAIVRGFKPVENRDWDTKLRGEFYIHAGATFDHHGYEWLRVNCPELPLPSKISFLMGGIVRRAKLVDVVTTHTSKYFFGKFGFILEDARAVPFVPLKGRLGFFRIKPKK